MVHRGVGGAGGTDRKRQTEAREGSCWCSNYKKHTSSNRGQKANSGSWGGITKKYHLTSISKEASRLGGGHGSGCSWFLVAYVSGGDTGPPPPSMKPILPKAARQVPLSFWACFRKPQSVSSVSPHSQCFRPQTRRGFSAEQFSATPAGCPAV